MNNYINITKDNIESEHLCCAIADKKHQVGVDEKKQWLREDLNNNHIFRKLDVNGKVFIEYAPLEKAWIPVIGENYLYIYCLWVAGSYKGKGYARELLEYAINDAKQKGKNGICIISSEKKKPFISEKKFFEKFGFKIVDTVDDYELLALSFTGVTPKFTNLAKQMTIPEKEPTIFYSCQCPYTANCIMEIKQFEQENNIKINFVKVDTLQKAKNVPCVFNNWATFINGKFISNTLLNKNSFEKLIK